MKWIIAALAAAVIFGALDAVWLRWAGPNLYEPSIGELMADEFNPIAAGAFYLIYLAGVLWFAIRPGLESGEVRVALINGILLGALCYATFDLTSQAVLKVWATKITVMDIAWGAFATGTTSAIVTWITLRLTPDPAANRTE
jgi:uncharacterized membrane protein